MNFKSLLGTGVAVLAMWGCSSDEHAPAAPEFKIVSSIRAARAPQLDANGAGNFSDGDENSVFVYSADQKRLLHELTYVYGKTYFWEDFNLPQDVKSCKVAACYPAVAAANPENFAWDIREPNAVNDFLVAAPADASTSSALPVVLTFSHALHRLNVTLTAETEGIADELLATAEIVCRNVKPVAQLNLLEGKATGASGSLAQLKETGTKASFIVPAQEVKDMEIAVRIGKSEKTFRLADCTANGQPLTRLESGKSFTLNIGVKEDHIFIIGQDISGWDNQGSADGTITLQ